MQRKAAKKDSHMVGDWRIWGKSKGKEKALEKKQAAKHKILDFMLEQKSTTKAELAKKLDLSMPTVLSNINELTEKGLVAETGEMESTGGRKARKISLQENYCYAVGVDITAHHIGMVLVDLGGGIVSWRRVRAVFRPDAAYCRELAGMVQGFYKEKAAGGKVLGTGIALPGILNKSEKILAKSHALGLENYSLNMMAQMMGMPVYFENDANAAMLAENPKKIGNAVYLSLNHTLGGAVCIGSRLFPGSNQKAGEFGHMLLVPGGRRCYCGKRGCADAYCAASVLTENGKSSLDAFMEKLGKDEEADRKWEAYLEHLAILVSNIRMVFDTDVILGGDVGGYLGAYMVELGEKVLRHSLFDLDVAYLKNCSYQREASAVGVAKHFFQELTGQL